MPRTPKTELFPSAADLPLLPSDLDGPPAVATAKTTETPPNTGEPRSDAPATLVERLRAQAEAEATDMAAQWQTVVRAVASETADDDQVSAVLYASGRSIEELEKAVARQRKINRLESLVATLPDAMAEQSAAQNVFNDLRVSQKLQTEQMVLAFKAAKNQLTTATCRWQSAKDAESDLFSLANPHVDQTFPQWTDPYTPHPAIAKQLLVEEIVNEQIRQKLIKDTGREPVCGSYSGSGVTPASRT